MAYDIEKFGFSPNILAKSGGDFKAFLKERYGYLKKDDVNFLLNKFYGEGITLEEDGKPSRVSKKVRKDSE